MEGTIEQQPITIDLDSVMDRRVVAKNPALPKPPLEFPDVSAYKYQEKVPCPYCKRELKAGYLHQHILIHSDIKPHGCSNCSYRSRWPGDVKLHEQKWCKLRSKPAMKLKVPEKNHMSGRLKHKQPGSQLGPEDGQYVNVALANPSAISEEAPDENMMPEVVKLSSENPSYSTQEPKQPTPEGRMVRKGRSSLACPDKGQPVVEQADAEDPPPLVTETPLEFPDVSGYKYEERVPCPYCKRRLKAGYLHQHILIHSDIKPYGCSKCSFRSRWPGDVKRHEQRSCSYRVQRKSNVRAHEKNLDLGSLECNVNGRQRTKKIKAAKLVQKDRESAVRIAAQVATHARMKQKNLPEHVKVAVGGDDNGNVELKWDLAPFGDENLVPVHANSEELDLEDRLKTFEASELDENSARQYVDLTRENPSVTPNGWNSVPGNSAVTSSDLQERSSEEAVTFAPGNSCSAAQPRHQFRSTEKSSSAGPTEYSYACMLCNFTGTSLESAAEHAATHNIPKTPHKN